MGTSTIGILASAITAFLLGMAGVAAGAQTPAGGRGRGAPDQPPPAPRAQAPIDLTGWWVSVVTEDWRWRMVTPARGDYSSVPINADGRRVADAWDPVRDVRDGNACKAYGAPAIMRVPGRLHIAWQDDNILAIETDAGTQTRLLRFGPAGSRRAPPQAPPVRRPAGAADRRTLQGSSVATWEIAGSGNRGAGGGAGAPPVATPRSGSLKVVTTGLRAGYLRKNGVPYSENTVLTEYFDRHDEPNGDRWFTVTTIVDDPTYLNQPFVTSSDFRKEPDGAKWRPTPCAAQ